MLERFRAFIGRFQSPEPPFDFLSFECRPPDILSIAQRLRLEERAARNGRDNQPPSHAKVADAPHEDIRQFVRGAVGEILAGYTKSLAALDRRIAETAVNVISKQAHNLGSRLKHDLDVLKARAQDRVDGVADRVASTRKELEAYRKRYGVDREPDYPQSHLYHWSILIFVLVAEAVVNMLFFERGSPQGLAGGFSIAVILAAVDVTVVFNLGRAMAWLVSPRRWYRAFATGATLVFLAWALFYNLSIGHVREELQVAPDRAMQTALDRFTSSPFALTQADSWALVAIGLVGSVLAMVSGLQWDEKHPGYGKLHRRWSIARADSAYLFEDSINQAQTLHTRYRQRLAALLQDARGTVVVLKNAIDAKQTLHDNVCTCIHTYGDIGHALAQKYRDANQRLRSGSPPAYFHEKLALDLSFPPAPAVAAERRRLTEEERTLDTLEAESEEIRAELDHAYRDFIRGIEALRKQAMPSEAA